MIQLVECPRDAMQGLSNFVPTTLKSEYVNSLLQVGFHTLDFGSFVSPKAIPQMKDTAEVLSRLDLSGIQTKLLAIIANERGADDAVKHEAITYLGFPFSISETFQQRNTNSSITESFERVKRIQEKCVTHGKQLVVYISMGFGNPYGDPWDADVVGEWTRKLTAEGIGIISLADTVGVADPKDISYIFPSLIPAFPNTIIGAHLHAAPHQWRGKVEAAYQAGCRRFDGALKGFGGCPMAKDELVGNLATENVIAYLEEQGEELSIEKEALNRSMQLAGNVFG